MSENKKCWACGKTLIEKTKTGLCPDCINKYGSAGATFLVLGLGFCCKKLIKNGGKITKEVIKVIKH